MIVRPAFRLAAAAMLLLASNAHAQLRVGHVPQLLIDDFLIESSQGLTKVQNRPNGGQVVLRADAPWEQRVFYPTVVQLESGLFRMYYNAGPLREPTMNVIAVAESRDGVRFAKPALGHVRENGQATNIVFQDAHGPSFAHDPADRAAPWRMVYFGPDNGMGAAASRDGLAFAPGASNPILANKADTQQSLVWDASIRKWVMFTRFWEAPRDGRATWDGFDHKIRSVARSESADFIHWSPLEVVIRRGAEDAALSDFYGLQVTIRHGVMIGLLWTSDWDDTRGRVGRQRAQLVVSRDSGHSWTRIDPRVMFFDLGDPGAFDSKIVWPSSIVRAGGHDLIYYLAANRDHGADPIPTFPRDKYSIGIRRIGHDRFVARVAGEREGRLTTKPLHVPAAARLRVNARIGARGYLRAWLTDASGRIVARGALRRGDGAELSVPLKPVGRGLAEGHAARLHFAVRDGELFGFGL